VAQLRAEGRSWSAIASDLDVSRATLHRRYGVDQVPLHVEADPVLASAWATVATVPRQRSESVESEWLDSVMAEYR
jgi:transposase-like protein